MITVAQIEKLVNEKLEGTEFFTVDISVDAGNKIVIEMDGPDGFPISECVNFSRHVEHSFDREIEDFSLKVTTPGLTKPLKIFKQYEKNVGRNLKVTNLNGEVEVGKLILAQEDKIELEMRTMERLEKKKKKVEVVRNVTIPMLDIKESRIELDF
ncbi:MAG: ribosome assembly cofactor RimP [Salibacteraceae bacterium]